MSLYQVVSILLSSAEDGLKTRSFLCRELAYACTCPLYTHLLRAEVYIHAKTYSKILHTERERYRHTPTCVCTYMNTYMYTHVPIIPLVMRNHRNPWPEAKNLNKWQKQWGKQPSKRPEVLVYTHHVLDDTYICMYRNTHNDSKPSSNT
jgi:hypothetical protein